MEADMSEAKSPGDHILEELEKRGWTQDDLARVLGRTKSRVNEIVLNKQSISVEVASDLASAFGTTTQLWLDREVAYRLSLANEDGSMVRRRARLFELAPIKEIQKRGWIKSTDEIGELESELCRFFGIQSPSDDPQISADFRKSSDGSQPTPLQRAWLFRAKQMAGALRIDKFSESRLAQCEKELVKLAGFPQEGRKVANLLSSFGIRFVIVEPLPGSKVDGAAFWLDEVSPVIALSMRFDRMDAFWFNLGHEFTHIKHKDAFSIDSNLVGQEHIPSAGKDPIERRADLGAAAMLIPPQQLESFILRIGPMYSKDRIIQFANKVKIHPGIIVGQLQHRGEIGFHANREMLVKIRDIVVPSAITDGWGETIDLKVFK
jgi:HTH-type transcriptional regulator / antitoxin HigA